MCPNACRLDVVDSMRGLAILLMLLQHSFLFLYAGAGGAAYPYVLLISRLSAPLFVLLAGYCVFLSGKRRTPSSGRLGFLSHILVRVFWLFILGFAVNVMRSFTWYSPNILHLIGFSVLVCSLLFLNSDYRVYSLVLGILVSYSLIGPPHYSSITLGSPIDYLVAFMAVGEYPIGSWVIYSVVGLGLAWFFRDVKWGGARILYVGEGLILLSFVLVYLTGGVGLSTNRAPFLSFMLGSIAAAYVLLPGISSDSRLSAVGHFLGAYGRHSLATYVIHIFLFSTVFGLLGLGYSLSEPYVLAVFFGFVAVSYPAILAYESRTSGLGKSGCT
jgi:uncharacterized membrane protein